MDSVYCLTPKRKRLNAVYLFSLANLRDADRLVIIGASFYQVFLDEKLVSFGPGRTAKGYARIREIPIPQGSKTLLIKLISYGIPSFDCDYERPYLGVNLYQGSRLVQDIRGFKAILDPTRIRASTKYSFQRGFVERFDLGKDKASSLELVPCKCPILLKGIGDTCHYDSIEGQGGALSPFHGFDEIRIPERLLPGHLLGGTDHYDVNKEFLEKTKEGWLHQDFVFPSEVTGLIKLKIDSQEAGAEAFVVFDEFRPNGKWVFGRSSCLDLVTLRLRAGQQEALTGVPYSFKFLRLIFKPGTKIVPSVIKIENDEAFINHASSDPAVTKVASAAENTFRQNAVDLFTDCPGRERAGWLCDSYFTGQAEFFFLGQNKIEHDFLENFLVGASSEIEKGMLPMCSPSQHLDHTFIPNWSLWFILEVEGYFQRTSDASLVKSAEQKIRGLYAYFEAFEDQEGFLENLHSWVFVEWSRANDPDYIKGVNFPTNMLYVAALEAGGRLYHDSVLLDKAQTLRKKIFEYSYRDRFYCDNATRENGSLVTLKDHHTETCQYYALFFGFPASESFISMMKDSFGPERKEDPAVGKSNAFIGNVLRFEWLIRLGEKKLAKEEMLSYFGPMAAYSGTLWEKSDPSASCNHGFTSVVALLLHECED